MFRTVCVGVKTVSEEEEEEKGGGREKSFFFSKKKLRCFSVLADCCCFTVWDLFFSLFRCSRFGMLRSDVVDTEWLVTLQCGAAVASLPPFFVSVFTYCPEKKVRW